MTLHKYEMNTAQLIFSVFLNNRLTSMKMYHVMVYVFILLDYIVPYVHLSLACV